MVLSSTINKNIPYIVVVRNNIEKVLTIRKGEYLGRIEGYTGSKYSLNVNTTDINKEFLYKLNNLQLPKEFV